MESERRARGQGRLYRPKFKDAKSGEIKECRVWYVQYYIFGKPVRESSGSKTKAVAERLLSRRLRDAEDGIAPQNKIHRVTYESIRDGLLSDYKISGRKSLRTSKDGKSQYVADVSALDDFFAGQRAFEIVTDKIVQFIEIRQSEGASNGTVNRSLAMLRRMFNLAVQSRKLREVPYFPMLREANPRRGFLEHGQFQKLRAELPEHLRAIFTMGYFTGMRLGEILKLSWSHVNLKDGTLDLSHGTTKNDEARTIPLASELLEMLKIERVRHKAAEFVFVFKNQRIKSFRKAWSSACERAGLGNFVFVCRQCKAVAQRKGEDDPETCETCQGTTYRSYRGLLFHDLRRSGGRNLVRAGVPEKVAMAITGHKTRSMFDRYNIVSDRDLKLATAKLEIYLQNENGAKSGQVDNTEEIQQPGRIQ
jgi:integrase